MGRALHASPGLFTFSKVEVEPTRLDSPKQKAEGRPAYDNRGRERGYTNQLVAGPTWLKNIFTDCEEPCLLYEWSIRIVFT